MGLICGHSKQLQLTYRPDEGPDEPEETIVPSDEPEPVPSDDVAVSNVEIAPPTPITPQSNMDTVDLLVILQL